MATTKKMANKKPVARKAIEPKEVIVPDNSAKSDLSVFEKMAVRFVPTTTEVALCDGITVSVRKRITLSELMMIVRQIVDACTDEDRGEVHFELFDYATKMAICAVYCGQVAPENNEIGYLAIVGEDRMYDLITPHIDKGQLDTIWFSSRERLNAKSNMFASAAARMTVDMLQKMNDLYDMMSSVASEIGEGNAEEAFRNIISLTDKQ